MFGVGWMDPRHSRFQMEVNNGLNLKSTGSSGHSTHSRYPATPLTTRPGFVTACSHGVCYTSLFKARSAACVDFCLMPLNATIFQTL